MLDHMRAFREVQGRSKRGHTESGPNSIQDPTERVARLATKSLTAMEDRLHGKITEHDGFSQILPMSAEGQVDALINEATDVNQLCQMYKGWMPFL
ncbi:unnamed protein product [Echinostoma caproni]|uniref:FATC domain-containing protein n=1 Tax=Echinostoma caproni TaxID=27848 RepID=A0A183B4X4_9TREM|nr:unnamed protein product [Echinostoma caproni]